MFHTINLLLPVFNITGSCKDFCIIFIRELAFLHGVNALLPMITLMNIMNCNRSIYLL